MELGGGTSLSMSVPNCSQIKCTGMAAHKARNFDLNIEKILEGWEVKHALRELIANALDEQVLSETKRIEIARQGRRWHIRDFGRGVHYENLTQNENPGKLQNPGKVIGKFALG